jgi:hypothetical protein
MEWAVGHSQRALGVQAEDSVTINDPAVLVIEPDPTTRDVLVRLFDAARWQCLSEESIRAGLTHVRGATPLDLIVCDLPRSLHDVVLLADATLDEGLAPSRVVFHGVSIDGNITRYLEELGFIILVKPQSFVVLTARARRE